MSALLTTAAVDGDLVGGFVGFIIWVLILVWIYNIAKRKGRHVVFWVVFGFFFSLLALVIILVLPSKRTTEERSAR